MEGNLKHLNSLASGMAVAVLLSLCCPDSLRAQNLIVSSSLVQLNGQVNGAAVTASVSLSSAPNPTTPFTASAINCVGSNWLTISPSTGNTPVTLILTATPGTLLAGTYSCTANFAAATSNIGVQVLFTVSTTGGTGTFTANPASVAFTHQLGTTPPAQSVTISASSATLFSATATTTSGGNWLLVGGTSAVSGTTGTASATFTASINPSGLVASTYSGTIIVTGTGAQTLNIPVSLTVNTNATLVVAPTALTFNYQLNTALLPAAQVVSLNTSGTQLTGVNASATTTSCGTGWLVVTPLSAQATPASLTVSVTIPVASPNVCSGYIQIFAFPGAISQLTSLDVFLGTTTVGLQWTAPGVDGNKGVLPSGSSYYVSIASYQTPSLFIFYSSATIAFSTSGTSPGADVSTAPTTGLIANTTFWVSVWTKSPWRLTSIVRTRCDFDPCLSSTTNDARCRLLRRWSWPDVVSAGGAIIMPGRP